LSTTESRFRLGNLVEALDRELPAVADLAVRRAIDLEVDQDIITPGLLIASAFPPAPARGAAVPPPAGSASWPSTREPYLRADGTKVWSLMQLERQLQPEAYRRRRGGYLDHRRTRSGDASRP
jgi:hypothetical protein